MLFPNLVLWIVWHCIDRGTVDGSLCYASKFGLSAGVKAAIDDVINELEYANHSLRVKYDALDSVESVRKSTIDHKEETAVTISGKQSRE